MAKKECCICCKNKTKKSDSGYEKLIKCVTSDAAANLQAACSTKKELYPNLYTELVGLELAVIVAKEYHYHESCRCILLKKLPQQINIKPNAFVKLKDYIQSKYN